MTEPIERELLHDALASAVNYIRWRDKGARWCSSGFDSLEQVLADCDHCLALLAQPSTPPVLPADLDHPAEPSVSSSGPAELQPSGASE